MEFNLEGLTLEDGDKEVRFAYLKERLGRLWHPVKGVTILPTPEGRFLFQFNHKKDAENALEDGPWVYDNSNLVLERINPGMVPRDVELNHLDMWVQVHNLPFGFVQQRVGTAIGAYLGELKEYDEKNPYSYQDVKKLSTVDFMF